MSKERYFELYRQFLHHTISRKDYLDLMDWVADVENDATLKRYMQTLWAENDWAVDERPREWSEFKKQFDRPRLHKKSARIYSLNQIWYYAASVVILLIAAYGIYQYLKTDVLLYQTAYGETQDILLDDGSMVTLNANSTLEWDEGWNRSGERYVKLTGEAFFDVEHTPDNASFTVETNDLKIRVLGTTFNVQSRHENTDVTLETGKIQLDLNRADENALEMEPGDRVRFSAVKNILQKEKVEALAQSANWLDGVLWFDDVSVEEMFGEIEDLYGKKLISKDSSLLSRRMFTGIPYEDWSVAKQALELALGVRIEERKNELYIR